jgi:hypothetical protein
MQLLPVVSDADRLLLGVKLDGMFAALATDSRLLDTTKGNSQVAHKPCVDPN